MQGEVLASPAICMRCGKGKLTPFARCPSCGHIPQGEEREVALLCSSRFLNPAQRLMLQERIRRGEAINPSPAARAEARARLEAEALDPGGSEHTQLSRQQMALLLLGNVLLTPMLGYAVWFRARGGPAGTQALLLTVPTSLLLGALIAAWRLSGGG